MNQRLLSLSIACFASAASPRSLAASPARRRRLRFASRWTTRRSDEELSGTSNDLASAAFSEGKAKNIKNTFRFVELGRKTGVEKLAALVDESTDGRKSGERYCGTGSLQMGKQVAKQLSREEKN